MRIIELHSGIIQLHILTMPLCFHIFFPVIKLKQQYQNRLPWLTEGLKKSPNKAYLRDLIAIDQPSNLAQIGYKSSIFQPMSP